MNNCFLLTCRKRKLALLSIVFFIGFSIWWAAIYFRGLTDSSENEWFTNLYFLPALWGGIAGLFISKRWGGHRSILGRAIGAFAIGLLGQAFGQIYYNAHAMIWDVEMPYPSIGDLGFFSTAFFYAYGLLQLAKAVGSKVSFKTYKGRGVAVILPLIFMAITYYIFLRGYEYDWQYPVRMIMDLTWPMIDSFFLSLAILVWLLSKRSLGGLMKWPILFLLFALIVEAVADLNFIYQFAHDTWYAGGSNDYMYLLSYTLMALALMYLGISFNKLSEE